MRLILPVLGALVVVMAPAFGGSQLRVGGIPLRVPENTLVLHVSESVQAAVGEDGVVRGVDARETPESVYGLVKAAAAAWTGTGKTQLEIRVERTAEWKLADSGLNLVTFTDPEPFDTGMCDKALYIACTLVFHTEGTGEIPMVKIAFNPYKKHSSLGQAGAHDLGVVLLHELGHAIGLDHSGALDSVMSPVVELEVQGGVDAARRLSADDVATVAMAYPAVEREVAPSYLAGAVMRDGVAVAKAHVMAFDRAGRVAAAGLSGMDGRYRLMVGEGEYRLAVEPLDGPVMAAQTWAEQAGQLFGSLWWTAGGGAVEGGDVVAVGKEESRVGLDFALGLGAVVNATSVGIVGEGGLYLGTARVTLARGREYPLAITRTPPEGAARVRFTLSSMELPTLPSVPSSAPQLVRQRVRIPADAALGEYTVTYETEGAISFLPGALRVVNNPVARSVSWLEEGWFLVTGEDLAGREVERGEEERPTQLAGVSVRVGDRFAELRKVSATEIVARWPEGLEGAEAAVSVVAGAGVTSEPLSLIRQ